MKAITDHFGAEDAPRLAIQAGCDLLIYRSEAAARLAYQACIQALESGKLEAETVLAAENRIRALKKETLTPYKAVNISALSEKIGTPENLALIENSPPRVNSIHRNEIVFPPDRARPVELLQNPPPPNGLPPRSLRASRSTSGPAGSFRSGDFAKRNCPSRRATWVGFFARCHDVRLL